MSKLIRQLLSESDPRFMIGLTRIESSIGNPGIDVRLTAEIISTTRQKVAALGLDPNDTTGAELYGALSSRAQQSEEHLVAYLGHPAHLDAGADALRSLITGILGDRNTWAIKHSLLRKIIRDNPPKKVMKAFHYQSAESMSKRMEPAEVLMAARLVESKTWWQKIHKVFEGLSNKDFEHVPLSVIALTDPRWLELLQSSANKEGHSTIHLKECASVGFVPLPGHLQYLNALLSTLRAANEVLLHGAFLKLHFVNPSIGNVLVHAMDEGSLIHSSLSGVSIHWRDIQRYFGLHVAEGDRYFSHLDAHDLGWLAIEIRLSLLIPDFSYWVGMDFCGVSYGDGRIISCNVADIAHSVRKQMPFNAMSTSALARALRSELMARYVAHPSARALVLKQFDISGNLEEDW